MLGKAKSKVIWTDYGSHALDKRVDSQPLTNWTEQPFSVVSSIANQIAKVVGLVSISDDTTPLIQQEHSLISRYLLASLVSCRDNISKTLCG